MAAETVDAANGHKDNPRGLYSYRWACKERAFIERDLIPASQFRSLAGDRAIRLGLGDEDLERLDQMGSLRPIAFAKGPFIPNPYVPGEKPELDGDLFYREEKDYVAWQEYSYDFHGLRIVSALYSPWQLLYAQRAIEGGDWDVPIPILLDREKLTTWADRLEKFQQAHLAHWQNLDTAWRKKTLLLVRIQNRYFPLVKGSTVLLRTADGDEKWAIDFEQERFRAEDALADLGLSVADVKLVHDDFAALAHFVPDPARDLYMLLRMMPYREREAWKGTLRQAHDLYDGCDMLRRFYFDLTGELLPAADEYGSIPTGWKQEFLGHPASLGYSREDLKRVLKSHHIYPHGLRLLVEGETEENLFPLLFDDLWGTDSGVAISNIHGVDNLALSKELLEAAVEYARSVMLVLDREGDSARQSEQWAKQGLLREELVVLWDGSLEEDNFTVEELVGFVRMLAEKGGVGLLLDAATLRSNYEDHVARVPVKGRKGLAEFLLGLARDPKHGAVSVSKTDLVRPMADLLLEEIRATPGGWEDLRDRRKIFRVLEMISLLL